MSIDFYPIEEMCAIPTDKEVYRRICFGMLNIWFYNSKTGQCEKFFYGGCGGNEKRFDTKEECEDFCMNKTKPHPK